VQHVAQANTERRESSMAAISEKKTKKHDILKAIHPTRKDYSSMSSITVHFQHPKVPL